MAQALWLAINATSCPPRISRDARFNWLPILPNCDTSRLWQDERRTLAGRFIPLPSLTGRFRGFRIYGNRGKSPQRMGIAFKPRAGADHGRSDRHCLRLRRKSRSRPQQGFRRAEEYLIEIGDAVVAVRRDNGDIKLNQLVNTTAAGAATGGMWGALVGLLFLNPLVGAALGAAREPSAGASRTLASTTNL